MSALPCHLALQPDTVTRILLVSPRQGDRISLRQIFKRSNWILEEMATSRETLGFLQKYPLPVVICARDLSDGNWEQFIASASRLPCPPRTIVASHSAGDDDDLWSEALKLGAYDVISAPFEATSVVTAIYFAWTSWEFEMRGQRGAVLVRPWRPRRNLAGLFLIARSRSTECGESA